ncbi:MAG: hypothetical protein F4138_04395 [Acidimicrobiia bacterium]|nr:hypothetical protein [Acidimicrobiia bacterium]
MGIARFVVYPFALLVVCAAGCGSAESSSVAQDSVEMALPALSAPLTGVPGFTGVSQISAATAGSLGKELAKTSARVSSTPTPNVVELQRWARNSAFYAFGDDVLGWDEQGWPLVRKIPVDHEGLEELRYRHGHQDGSIPDNVDTRLWLQECLSDRFSAVAGSSEAVQGTFAAQGLYLCLGALVHLEHLRARYWWSEAGLACVGSAAINYAFHGEDAPRPLAVCPSQGYNPTAPRPSGWLRQQCLRVVGDHLNPAYPSGSADGALGQVLPSCWQPLLDTAEAHAKNNAELGLPDSPHDCFHAVLGYVWARQSGLDSRAPNDLYVGCGYSASEALR